MPRRTPASEFERAFRLGVLWYKGHTLKTASIRREFGVSRATAKRDAAKVRALTQRAKRY